MRAKSVVQGRSSCRHEVVVVADDPVDLLDQVEVPDDGAGAVVDQHEPVERRARVHLDPPHAAGVGRRVGGPAHPEHGRVPEAALRTGRRSGSGAGRAVAAGPPSPARPGSPPSLGYVAPGTVARDTEAVTEPSCRSGRRSTATAPPITGQPVAELVNRTTSSPVTARDTVPATRRVPGSATPTSAPYRLRWARAASRGDVARVTAGLRAPRRRPPGRAVGAAGHAHRAACVGSQPGQGPVARGHAGCRGVGCPSVGRPGSRPARARRGEGQHGPERCSPASHGSPPSGPVAWSPGNLVTGARGVRSRTGHDRRNRATVDLRQSARPAALRSASTRSVRSQVNSGSSRPKWPYAAVLA